LEKKKIDVTSVPPSDWPCYERLDYLFASIIKIIGIPQGFYQGVYTTHKESKILSFSTNNESFNLEPLKGIISFTTKKSMTKCAK